MNCMKENDVADEHVRRSRVPLRCDGGNAVSNETASPQHPPAGGELPPTRKQLREREREVEHAQNQPVADEQLPTRRSLRAQAAMSIPETVDAVAPVPAADLGSGTAASIPAEAVSEEPDRTAPESVTRSKPVRVPSAAVARSGASRRRKKVFASKAFSCVAMLFAGAILVGVSVPSNALISPGSDSAVAAEPQSDAAQLSAASLPTQSLAVSDDVVNDVVRNDNLKVISYAEILALQYAGISYEYQATAGAIRWPFPYTVPITDGFGDRIGGFHKGTDFTAGLGAPIYAIADGVVSYVQSDYTGYGYNAIIMHVINGQKVESQYAHMVTNSSPLVVGEPVRVGDFVGLVGNTGLSYGAHLHLEIHPDGVPVDPFAWLTANATD